MSSGWVAEVAEQHIRDHASAIPFLQSGVVSPCSSDHAPYIYPGTWINRGLLEVHARGEDWEPRTMPLALNFLPVDAGGDSVARIFVFSRRLEMLPFPPSYWKL